MKNFLLTLIVMMVLVACNVQNAEEKSRDIQLLSDSTVYRNNNIYSDTMVTVANEPVPSANSNVDAIAEKPRVRVQSTRQKSNKDQVYTSSDQNKVEPPLATPPIANSPAAVDSANTTETAGIGDAKDSNTGVGSTQPIPEKKKGWNKATQGAVIGGAAGAVSGAIISKKKGLGAVIGGVVGAAGGYILGKKADKKAEQTAND